MCGAVWEPLSEHLTKPLKSDLPEKITITTQTSKGVGDHRGGPAGSFLHLFTTVLQKKCLEARQGV